MDMIRSAPIIQVRDVVRSEAFYCEKLGFNAGGMWGEPPVFCIIRRGTVTLFLDQTREEGAPIPLNQYWAAYIYVEDVDAYLKEVTDKGVEIIRGPEDMRYGCRDFDIRDPDGHLICFGQALNPGKLGPGL